MDTKYILVLDQLFDRIKNILPQHTDKKVVIVPIENSMPLIVKVIAHFKLKKNIPYGNNIIKWNEFIKSNSYNTTESVNDTEASAVMVFSSGTTGASKGIILTNKGINATISHYEYTDFQYKREDTNLQYLIRKEYTVSMLKM